MLAAALLHDAVEDSQLTVGEIVERFGAEIGEIVAALTEDPSIEDWVERKDGLRAQVVAAGASAVAVYAADKLEKLRETREMYESYGEGAINLHKAPSLDLRVAAWRADLDSGAPRRCSRRACSSRSARSSPGSRPSASARPDPSRPDAPESARPRAGGPAAG